MSRIQTAEEKERQAAEWRQHAEKLVSLVRLANDPGQSRLKSYLRKHSAGGVRPKWIDTVTAAGLSALHWACREDRVEAVSALVRHGADPLCGDAFGSTPAHHAALTGSAHALERLFEEVSGSKAKSSSTSSTSDKNNHTGNLGIHAPAISVGDSGSSDAAGALFATAGGGLHRSSAKPPAPDVATAFADHAPLLAVLRATNTHGETPLHCALAATQRHCAAALVEWGAPTDAVTNYGCTVLDLADAVSRGAVLLAMAERSAEISAEDANAEAGKDQGAKVIYT